MPTTSKHITPLGPGCFRQGFRIADTLQTGCGSQPYQCRLQETGKLAALHLIHFLHTIQKLAMLQVARSLYLLGQYGAADHIYSETAQIAPRNWEVWHNRGVCSIAAKDYDRSSTPCISAIHSSTQAECSQPTALTFCRAIQNLLQAKAIEQHDCTLLQLGKVHALQADYSAALSVYLEALQLDPANAETLTTIGLLYLRTGQNQKAFDFLGNALSHDPKSVKAILAAASVIQVS